jgi:ElaB/YqjD/DUF883 family membrane-anchored ribosome-binding protein
MTRSATKGLGEELEGNARNAAHHLRREVDRVSDDAEGAVTSAAEALARAAETLTEEARAHARVAARTAAEDIRSRPLVAVGAAAAAGVLVGLLLGRRR